MLSKLLLGFTMLVSEAVAAFLSHVDATREPPTVKTYRSRLDQLRKSLGDRDVSSLTAEDLQQWLTSQHTFADGREKAPDTIRLTMIALDLWQAWLVKQGHVPAIILPKQRKPGGRKREMLPDQEETRRLLEIAPEDFRQAYRALRLTGARPGELVRFRVEDLDRRQGLIVLAKHKTFNKTGRPRKIAVGHPALVELLDTAIGSRTAGPIFLRTSGRPWTVEALSAAYRRLRKAAGLPSGLVLYLARHEHATQLYKATGDLKAVADALGHTQLNTTMRYTRADAETLKRNQGHFSEGL